MSHQKHIPSFQWKDNVIYDGDDPIAHFTHDPEAKRHIHLDRVKLTPNGDPLVQWTLSWRYSTIRTTAKLESLDARRVGDDLRLTFTASTPDQSHTANTRIDLSFDQRRQCYRFEANSSLRENVFPFYSWKEIDSADFLTRQLTFPSEFANFMPMGSHAYWAPVDPTPKKWQAFAYQNTKGGWSRVPHHHLLTPDKHDIQFPAGTCRMGFVDDPSGNPCVELIERMPSTSRCDVCWAMNDLHLQVNKTPLMQNVYRVRYALYQFTPEETKEIVEKAENYTYTDEEKEAYDRPRFNDLGSCDFELGFDLEKTDDCFQFWLLMGDIQYASWTRGEGRDGGRCLKQNSLSPAKVFWQVQGTNAPVVQAGKRYRVSAWVKTRELKGEAYLEAWDVDCKSPASLPSEPPIRSTPLKGTTDWREVAVDVDVIQGLRWEDSPHGNLFMGKIAIRLAHEGQGSSWFDDVAIREVGPAEGMKS